MFKSMNAYEEQQLHDEISNSTVHVERQVTELRERIESLEASVSDLNGFEDERYRRMMNEPKRKRRVRAATRARQALSGNR